MGIETTGYLLSAIGHDYIPKERKNKTMNRCKKGKTFTFDEFLTKAICCTFPELIIFTLRAAMLENMNLLRMTSPKSPLSEKVKWRTQLSDPDEKDLNVFSWLLPTWRTDLEQ